MYGYLWRNTFSSRNGNMLHITQANPVVKVGMDSLGFRNTSQTPEPMYQRYTALSQYSFTSANGWPC